MFQYTQADIQQQVAALPPAFQLWFQWMFAIIVLAPVLFIMYRQGRVVIAFSVIFLAVQFPLMRITGLSNFLSLTHLLIWGPLVIYLVRELETRRIKPASIFGVWALTAVTTALISLVFDVRDFGHWIAGERGVVQPAAETAIPWLWVVLIVLTVVGTWWYIFRPKAGAEGATQ